MPKSLISILLLSIGIITNAQTVHLQPLTSPSFNNADFLEFSGDPVSGAMGEAGVIASPFYPYSGLIQNPSLLSKNADIVGANFSYSPWLRKLVPSIELYDFNIYYPLSEKQTIAYRMRYFDWGSLLLAPGAGAPLEYIYQSEFLSQLSYSRDLTNHLSAGISLKYFRSNKGEYTLSSG